MDFILRCNNQHCRCLLTHQGVVTTCSHIFCIKCSNKVFAVSKVCPACDTSLDNPDDISLTLLNPTEEYKSSVLAGLSPAVISEISSRALSFWSYQYSQELLYQEFIVKSLSEKIDQVVQDRDRIARAADADIDSLKRHMNALKNERETLSKKNSELVDSLHDKSRQFTKLQALYDKLKRKMLLGSMQNAADEIVNNHNSVSDSGFEVLNSSSLAPDRGLLGGHNLFNRELFASIAIMVFCINL
ncbi:hypothetical protein V1506DRAFT_539510 [Lipomyces tetrasporus]